MHIKQKISQHRRDFTALYTCGHCGHEEKGSGYDDSHFHNNVIPAMKCPMCGNTEQASSAADVPAHIVL